MIKRSAKLLIELVAITVAGATVLLVLAVVRLASGPVDLDFLTSHIESGLNAEEGDFRVRIGGTVLTWSSAERDIDLLIEDVRILSRQGAERAFVPEVAIGLSVRALLQGEFRPTRFALLGPRMKVIREEDGQLTFGDPAPAPPAIAGPRPEGSTGPQPVDLSGDVAGKVLHMLLEPPAEGHPLRYLEAVEVRAADLEFEDRRNGFQVRAPDADFELHRIAAGIAGSAQLRLRLGETTARVGIRGRYSTAGETVRLDADFRDLVPASLAQLGPPVRPLAAARFPTRGTAALEMDGAGRIDRVSVDARGGPGVLVLDEAYDEPVEIRSMRLAGTFEGGSGRLDLERASVDFGGAEVVLSGRAEREGEGTRVALDATARNVTVPDMKRLWPKGVAPGGRVWVLENVVEGAIPRADAKLGFTMPGAVGVDPDNIDVGTVEVRFGFKNVAVHFLKPLPAVTGIAGNARMTAADEIVFEAATGRLVGLGVDNAKVWLYGLDKAKERQFLDAEVVTRGPLSAALTLLDHPRLDLLEGFGLKPSAVGGEMATRLAVKVPLLKDVTIDGIDIAAASNLRDVRIPDVAFDSDLTHGDLSLQLDKRGMDVSGPIRLAGVPARLAWTENFLEGARYRGRYGLKGRIDEVGWKRLGFSAAPYVEGPVGFDIVMTRYGDGRSEVFATLGLEEAALAVDEIEWSKPPGVPGMARFFLDLRDEKVRAVRNLSLRAGDLEARGSVRLGPDGTSVENFQFGKLAFGQSDIRIAGEAEPSGGLRVSVAGPSLDIRPFLEARREEGPKLPLEVAVDVAAVRVGAGPPIVAVEGRLARGTGDWRYVDIRGRVGDRGEPVRVSIMPQEGGRALRIVSDDAGATLKSFDITDDMVGGRLAIRGRFDDAKKSAPLKGKLTVKEFRMVRAPLIAKLLGVMSLTGILDALAGKGLGFVAAEVPFTKTGDLLELGESRAYGSALGFTAKGWIDLEKDRIDLAGTVVPAYTLNSVFGYIPLLGPLLTGEKGSGVFAATYRMQGPLDDPEISHNPLATLTPGFLRGLFNIFEAPVSEPPARQSEPPAADGAGKPPVAEPSPPPAPVD